MASALRNGGTVCAKYPDISQQSIEIRKLIGYIFTLKKVINQEKIFIIDDMERNTLPLAVKALFDVISGEKKVQWQIIFTTRQQCLFDDDIFKMDEVWFCQKGDDGASEMYALCDIHLPGLIDFKNN